MTKYKTVKINGLDIFYREAGPKNATTILLLHGFPTSSHMFRNLIQILSDEFHLVAPDYPGYANSSMAPVDEFDYTFENMAKIIYKFVKTIGLENYSLYMQDYGAPIGYRLFSMYPEKLKVKHWMQQLTCQVITLPSREYQLLIQQINNNNNQK